MKLKMIYTIFTIVVMLGFARMGDAQSIDRSEYTTFNLNAGETVGGIVLRETRKETNWRLDWVIVLNSETGAQYKKTEAQMRKLPGVDQDHPGAPHAIVLIQKKHITTVAVQAASSEKYCATLKNQSVSSSECRAVINGINQMALRLARKNAANPVTLSVPAAWTTNTVPAKPAAIKPAPKAPKADPKPKALKAAANKAPKTTAPVAKKPADVSAAIAPTDQGKQDLHPNRVMGLLGAAAIAVLAILLGWNLKGSGNSPPLSIASASLSQYGSFPEDFKAKFLAEADVGQLNISHCTLEEGRLGINVKSPVEGDIPHLLRDNDRIADILHRIMQEPFAATVKYLDNIEQNDGISFIFEPNPVIPTDQPIEPQHTPAVETNEPPVSIQQASTQPNALGFELTPTTHEEVAEFLREHALKGQ